VPVFNSFVSVGPDLVVRSFVTLLRIVCGAGSMKRWSVRPSVCPSVYLADCPTDQQQQQWPAGLLLSAPRAGDIDRPLRVGAMQQAHRSAVNSGSVTLTAHAGGWTLTCLVFLFKFLLWFRVYINITQCLHFTAGCTTAAVQSVE